MPPLKKVETTSNTARDFVLNAMQKNDVCVGVKGYVTSKPLTDFDKPVVYKIH